MFINLYKEEQTLSKIGMYPCIYVSYILSLFGFNKGTYFQVYL